MPKGFIRHAYGEELVNLSDELDTAIGRHASSEVFRGEVRYPKDSGLSQKPTAIQLMQTNESQRVYPDIDSVITDRLADGIIRRSHTMQKELHLVFDGQRIGPNDEDDLGEQFLILELNDSSLDVLLDERDHIKRTYDTLANLGNLATRNAWKDREPDLTIIYYPAISSRAALSLRQESIDTAQDIIDQHLPLAVTVGPAVITQARGRDLPR